ncbi:glycosyltransferase family 2 protein [Candidatus Bathyarchaeota archaeon]|nr:glycosyltransferase family 2 protein [Candidatus Bathyarchaeota archaeon]
MENWIISVIVPAFNEEGTIAETLKRLSQLQYEIGNLEIIVVDDGSEDNTSKEVANFANVKYIKHPRNMGKGAALNTGIRESIGEVIVIQDADLEYFPEKIPELVAPILKEDVDIIYGTRLFNGVPEGMSFSHYMGNKMLSFVAAMMYGVELTDVMTGYKAFRRKVLDSFEMESKGFGIEIELTAKSLCNGWKFKEIPLAYSYRKKGVSKIRYIDGFKCLLQIIRGSLGLFDQPKIDISSNEPYYLMVKGGENKAHRLSKTIKGQKVD